MIEKYFWMERKNWRPLSMGRSYYPTGYNFLGATGILCLIYVYNNGAKSIQYLFNSHPLQGSKGIRHWQINWCKSPMKKINKLPLLQIKIRGWNVWTLNQSKFTEVPKVVRPTKKKRLLQNFGDFCNKQTNVPSLHAKFCYLCVYK